MLQKQVIKDLLKISRLPFYLYLAMYISINVSTALVIESREVTMYCIVVYRNIYNVLSLRKIQADWRQFDVTKFMALKIKFTAVNAKKLLD